MEDLIAVLSIAPVVGALVSVVASLFVVFRRSEAEKHFIKAVSQELSEMVAAQKQQFEAARRDAEEAALKAYQAAAGSSALVAATEEENDPGAKGGDKLSEEAERIGDHDPALVRSLYFESMMKARDGLEGDKDPRWIFISAMNDLGASDRRLIKRTLKNNSKKGRVRYLDKVFKAAARLVVN